jgi:glycosyltransferase involved in cell wall biosynthesis
MEHRQHPRVIVFRADLLPISETFVKEQVLALSRWRPVLTGFRRVNGLDLSGLDYRLLTAWGPEKFSPRAIPLFREFGVSAPGLRWQLRKISGNLVHVHFATDLVAAWPALRGLGVPIVTTLHGFDINIYKEFWQQFGRAHRLYPKRLLQIARHPAVHFVAVSEAIRARAIEYGIAAEKISVKYIGVDATRFRPADHSPETRKRRVLFVGRMVEKKGAGLLIRAFARVREHVPDAELTMVGDGPLLAENRQLASDLEVPVAFLGSLPHDAIRQQVGEARVLCAPSITAASGDAEGFAIVILEAMASGVPVVSSARGGALEAINHQVTGWRFPENDADALVAALIQALTDDALISSMSRAARIDVDKRFDLRRCTAALEDLYDELTERAGALRSGSNSSSATPIRLGMK